MYFVICNWNIFWNNCIQHCSLCYHDV